MDRGGRHRHRVQLCPPPPPQHPAFDYPVVAVLVDLDEGVRVLSNLVDIDPDEIRIGIPVEVTFASTADECAVPVFRPASRPTHDEGDGRVDRGHRADRVLEGGRTHRAQLAAEAIVAALADAGLDAARGRRTGQLHDRSGRGDRAGPLGRDRRRSAGPAECPTAAGVRRACCSMRPRPSQRGSPTSSSPTGQSRPAREPGSGGPRSSDRAELVAPGTTAGQWCSPYGVLTPASWMALNATRYMHASGSTSADFGRAVVQLRAYAATNPNAHFSGGRSRSRITRLRAGSPSRASGCSTAARRPTAQSPSS